MKIMKSSQGNGEETAKNPWDMETNLQYIDKRLAHHVISTDDSLLYHYNSSYTHVLTRIRTVHVNTRTNILYMCL